MSSSKVFKEAKIKGSIFDYALIKIKELPIAIIIDKDLKESVSVTNNIEEIASELKVSKIIYKDTEGIFDYWDNEIGFRSLSLNKKPTINLLDAIKIAEIGYIR
jgi:hypothetical protein